MKKILNITLAAAFACAMTGCQDFLDTSSPSVVDRDFVFSNEESALIFMSSCTTDKKSSQIHALTQQL